LMSDRQLIDQMNDAAALLLRDAAQR